MMMMMMMMMNTTVSTAPYNTAHAVTKAP